MFKKLSKTIVMIAMLTMTSSQLSADKVADAVKDSGLYVGIQGLGLSIKKDFTDNFTGQLVAGWAIYTRGIYKFAKEDYYNFYGYGEIGMWAYRVLDVGVGAGFEYDVRGFGPDVSVPIFLTADLGLHYYGVGVTSGYYDGGGILPSLSIGIHYKF